MSIVSAKEDKSIDFNDFDEEKMDIHGDIKQFVNPLLRENLKGEGEEAEKLFQEKVKLKYKLQILMKNKLKTVNKLNTLT